MSTFRERYGPWALVAGASQGIGAEYSRQLAERGLNVILVARRKEPLQALAVDLRDQYGVETLAVSLDLASPELSEEAAQLATQYEIGLLVYNACYSEIGDFFDTTLESKLTSVNVNCRGPLVMVSALAPPMMERKRGGILLMSSMAGFQGSAMVSTYAATKAFNTVLAEGLWEDLGRFGIDVLGMAAGATKTPNFNAQTPEDKQAATFPMEPADVAREALNKLGRGPTVVAGRMNATVHFVFRHLVSRKAAIKFFAKTTRKVYAAS